MDPEPAPTPAAFRDEERVEAAGMFGGTEAGEKNSEQEAFDAKIWELPLSLAGKIVSYNTSTTTDVAKVSQSSRRQPHEVPLTILTKSCLPIKLREVSRAFGQTIRSQISSKNSVSHTITCPGRLGDEKSFVPALTRLGEESDEQSMIPGDIIGSIDQSIFSGEVTLQRAFFLGDGAEEDGVDTKMSNETADGKNALAQEIRDAIELIDNAKSMEEFESICRDAKSRGLFAPIKKGGDVHDDDCSICSYDYSTQKVMAEFTLHEDSDCIVATSEMYLELQTSDDVRNISDVHPMHPKSLYIAPITETKESGAGKVFSVSVLLDIIYAYGIEDTDLVSSLSYEILKHEHQNCIGPVEGVTIVDDFLGEDLVQTLTSNVDALATYQEEHGAIDYHPHSNNVVRDIVHPGLYSYVKGVSELRASVGDAEPCSLPSNGPHDDNLYARTTADLENDGYGEGIADFWGRNEWDKYQWLPTYFDISAEGDW